MSKYSKIINPTPSSNISFESLKTNSFSTYAVEERNQMSDVLNNLFSACNFSKEELQIKQTQEDIEKSFIANEAIEKQTEILEKAINEDEVTDNLVTSVESSVTNILKLSGLSDLKQNSPTVENFYSGRKTRARVALESSGGIVSKIWEGIKKAIKWIINTIKSIFKAFFSFFAKIWNFFFGLSSKSEASSEKITAIANNNNKIIKAEIVSKPIIKKKEPINTSKTQVAEIIDKKKNNEAAINKELTVTNNESKELNEVSDAVKRKEIEIEKITLQYRKEVLEKLSLFLLRNYKLFDEFKNVEREPEINQSLYDFIKLLSFSNNWIKKNLFDIDRDRKIFNDIKIKTGLKDEDIHYKKILLNNIEYLDEYELLKEIVSFVNKINGFETDFIRNIKPKDLNDNDYIKKLDSSTNIWYEEILIPTYEPEFFSFKFDTSEGRNLNNYNKNLFKLDELIKEHEEKFLKDPIEYRKSIRKFTDSYDKGHRYMNDASKSFEGIASYVDKMEEKYKKLIFNLKTDFHLTRFLNQKYYFIVTSILTSLSEILSYLKNVFVHNVQVSLELFFELNKEDFKFLIK